jgi:hypothetical protein
MRTVAQKIGRHVLHMLCSVTAYSHATAPNVMGIVAFSDFLPFVDFLAGLFSVTHRLSSKADSVRETTDRTEYSHAVAPNDMGIVDFSDFLTFVDFLACLFFSDLFSVEEE